MLVIIKKIIISIGLIYPAIFFIIFFFACIFFPPYPHTYWQLNKSFDRMLFLLVDIFDKIWYSIKEFRNRRKKERLRKSTNYMKTITIYTDGACSGNPGPGGWGAILQYGEHTKELSGGEKLTTNNRMELTGVIRALQALKEPCIVELYSDSKYIIDALEKGWARGWRARGWVKSDKKPALNPDLWETLLDLCQVHQVRTHWVKGHAENPYNNRCDQLAVGEWRKLKEE